MIVEQAYMTERGRRRRRLVRVDLDEVSRGLGIPTAADRGDWRQIRELLEGAVGDSTVAIWLEPTELIAVDRQHRLVVGSTGSDGGVDEHTVRSAAGALRRPHRTRTAVRL